MQILLLGAGESGKSTIMKQMKILHQNGFSREELLKYRLPVYQNVVESAQAIVKIRSSTTRSRHHRTSSKRGKLAIHNLWQDPIIPKIMDHSSEFYLMDSASYFFSEVLPMGKPDYMPTEADVLRARQKTIGVVETRFTMGQLSIHMVGMGDQRSERRKWIHCFESVTAIIFCTTLSEYDQNLLDHMGQNGLIESLFLFESVVTSRWFFRTSIILFLNKIDVFKSKIAKVPLEGYVPEYAGGQDINKSAKFILLRFMQRNRVRLSVYPPLRIWTIFEPSSLQLRRRSC